MFNMFFVPFVMALAGLSLIRLILKGCFFLEKKVLALIEQVFLQKK